MKNETSRRVFLKAVAATTSAAAGACAVGPQGEVAAGSGSAGGGGEEPWFKRAMRWGQINITEADVQTFDVGWWRKQWRQTRLQGVILNAGGIVAYYPSKYELQHRPPALGDRDLFGELRSVAREEGIAVLARMDSSKAYEPLYRAHPEWFAVDAEGRPYRSGEFYLSCINTGYYAEWLPGIMREIAERSKPEGFGDNIWSGVERSMICYCGACKERFRAYAGAELPTAHNWEDATYRKWIEWSYRRRIEQWEFNNRVTKEAGGANCLWVGMNGAGPTGQGSSFRDLKEIAERAEFLLLDQQSRSDATGFHENVQTGKLVHSLLGWEKLAPESMAMYQHGRPQFRLSAKPEREVRMWMLAGFAGGIMPWWHHVGAYSEDRRAYATAAPLMRWHEKNGRYLTNRRPVAPVALGWSNRNADYFGRDNTEENVSLPWQGWTNAMVRARIPYVPLHLDHLDRDAGELSVLILANVGVLTESQVAAVRRFAAKGGAVVASGQTGLYDAEGKRLGDFALAELLGVHDAGAGEGARPARVRGAAATAQHTYLRLLPGRRGITEGPHRPDEPRTAPARHAVLAGFEQTDILPFGSGGPWAVKAGEGAKVLATFVPSFPATPPEISYMRTTETDVPALVVKETQAGRMAYLAADIDRLYAQFNLADHGELLANIVRWAAREALPITVEGAGFIDVSLYRQEGRLIVHLLNLTNENAWRAPLTEVVPVGPLEVTITVPAGMKVGRGRSLVTGKGVSLRHEGGKVRAVVERVEEHEVLVLE